MRILASSKALLSPSVSKDLRSEESEPKALSFREHSGHRAAWDSILSFHGEGTSPSK